MPSAAIPFGHVAEYIRDVPASCECEWQWNPAAGRYMVTGHTWGCAWHEGPAGAGIEQEENQ